jgi:uncharacterized protein
MQEFIDVDLSRRVQHPDGFIVAPANLARAGVQLYRAFELDVPGDPMREIAIFRPPEEVFAADSLATYNGIPITNGHIGRVDPKNWRKMADGMVMSPRRAGHYVRGDVGLASQEVLDAVASGKKQFSATYDAILEWTPGTHDGEPYEAIQRKIRVNSVALVKAARCGAACSMTDSNPDGDLKMGTRKVLLDGIPLDLDDVAAAAVEKVQGQLTAAQNTIAQHTAALAAVVKFGDASLPVSNPAAIQAVLDDQTKRINDMAKDVMTPAQRDAMVADWVKTMDDAKRLAPKVTTDGKTCAAIRREVVDSLYTGRKALMDAVLGGKSVKDADDPAIRTAFAVLASSAPDTGTRRVDAVADAMSTVARTEQQQDGKAKPEPALTADGLPDPDKARENWMKAQQNALRAHA